MIYRKTTMAQAELVDGNAVVMNIATMQCFVLNDMASALWDAMDQFPQAADLLELLREAEVENPEAALDQLVTQLLERGLIETSPP